MRGRARARVGGADGSVGVAGPSGDRPCRFGLLAGPVAGRRRGRARALARALFRAGRMWGRGWGAFARCGGGLGLGSRWPVLLRVRCSERGGRRRLGPGPAGVAAGPGPPQEGFGRGAPNFGLNFGVPFAKLGPKSATFRSLSRIGHILPGAGHIWATLTDACPNPISFGLGFDQFRAVSSECGWSTANRR